MTTAFDGVAGRLLVTSNGADSITVTAVGPVGYQVAAVHGQRSTVPVGEVRTL